MTEETSVRQFMRTIISIDSRSRVKDAAKLMVEKGIGSLIANRDGLPFGIITERDLMEKIVAEGADPAKITVNEIMTAPLLTIDAAASIADATRKMVEKRVKRLVVTDREKVIGIVSQTDLVRWVADFRKLAKMGMA